MISTKRPSANIRRKSVDDEVLYPRQTRERVPYLLMDLSNDYLHSALFLCRAILTKDFDQGYGAALVVMNLARQSLELYFKAVLTDAEIVCPKTHRLTTLNRLYLKGCPEYRIECPFDLNVEPNLPLFPSLSDPKEEFSKTLDQRVRYPTDPKDRIFVGNQPFDPADFYDGLIAMQTSMAPLFLRIWWR